VLAYVAGNIKIASYLVVPYVPGAAEFMSGAVKSNDVSLLFTFQKVFQLESAGS